MLKNRAELLDAGPSKPGEGMAALKSHLDMAGRAMGDTASELTVPEADLVRDASNQVELLEHLDRLTDVPALKDAYAKASPCVDLKAALESFGIEMP